MTSSFEDPYVYFQPNYLSPFNFLIEVQDYQSKMAPLMPSVWLSLDVNVEYVTSLAQLCKVKLMDPIVFDQGKFLIYTSFIKV